MMNIDRLRRSRPGGAVLVLCGIALVVCAYATDTATEIPPPAIDSPKEAGPLQTAILAGGCFWGTQGVYQHVRGVREVLAGYAGGEEATANYQTVGTGRTGHAESVKISFDPQQISYGELLQIYFSVAHDPTQLDRQGPDVGPEYRSAIFYTDDRQKRIAQSYIAQLNEARVFDGPIVTTVSPDSGFYPAEDYHQDFLVKHPRHPYIVVHDLPKLGNLETLYPDAYRDRPVTVASTSDSTE